MNTTIKLYKYNPTTHLINSFINCSFEDGITVLQACELAGIQIPRFAIIRELL
ncbi:hypothetical protein IMW62_02320 [Ehrlichia ruminantium]|nr:hypothetical protein [Ehrlichia ruminantium]UOE00163.1 hypothetical protein IMW62_02320 [Ehrlichia ruminantium]